MGMKQKKIVIFSNPPIFHFEKTMKKSEKVNSKGMHVAQSIYGYQAVLWKVNLVLFRFFSENLTSSYVYCSSRRINPKKHS